MQKYIFLIVFLLCYNLKAQSQLEFFEKNIRPVLSSSCYKCHASSSDKVKGALLLDSKAGLLKGGENGPVVIAGSPEKSSLYKGLTHKDSDFQMPPKEKLDDAVIKNFELWIKNGAYYPESKNQNIDIFSSARSHWSYTSLIKPNIPNIQDPWINNDIDKFVLSKQKENKLSPSPSADKKTIIRRLYYDLTGLPPTEEEVVNFINDKSPAAYENLVDKLLASPRYGERWGRKWLDTARYSDTTGTINNNREPRFTYSHTYRDYVIKSLNEDKPFDRFALEQIAADKLKDIKKEDLAALGYLTLGKDSANINDIIDDRIDVITKGFMASTMVCARCHDHKFDPFTTKDYYALHGIMNSSYVPDDASKPILKPIVNNSGYQDYLNQRKLVELGIEKYINTNYYAAMLNFKTNTANFLYGGYILNSTDEGEKQNYIRENSLNPRIMQKWGQAMRTPVNIPNKKGKSKSSKSYSSRGVNPVFLPYSRMFNVPEKTFAAEFSKFLKTDKENINSYLYSFFEKNPVRNMKDLANIYQAAIIYSEKPTTNEDVIYFRDSIFKNGGPLDIDKDNFQRFYANNQLTMRYDNLLRAERGKLITLELNHPNTPYRAMAMVDKSTPANSPVLIKGEPNSRGPVVSHRFVEFFSPTNKTYLNGSGRLELASDIIKTPLFARTIVNRIWQGHFDEGFCKTPDDFGTSTETPAMFDLMNYLSCFLIENNYSLKSLHKLIVTSSTYQQVCLDNPRKSFIDPENKYFWRMNLIRLDFEELRDTLLFLGGRLDYTMGGPSVDLFAAPQGNDYRRRMIAPPRNPVNYSTRRSVYGYIDRNRLAETLTTFDFATPEMTTGKRFRTTVSKQALFLMNNSFVLDQIKAITQKKDFTLKTTPENKIDYLYSIIYQRDPTKNEIKIGLDFIKENGIDSWDKYVQILLLSNEVMFVN